MATQTYDQASQRFLAQARAKFSNGDLQQASENGWGAVAQMLKAIAEQRGWEHNRHRHYLTITSWQRAQTGAWRPRTASQDKAHLSPSGIRGPLRCSPAGI